MDHFVARVELHGATWQDYNVLHEALSKVGFAGTIRGSDGKNYKLPSGTYYSFNSRTLEQNLNLAKQAAATTGKANEVIIVQGPASWHGLSTT